MALLIATLATELEAMVPVDTEAEGIDNFATAFDNYFFEATAQGVSIVSQELTAGAKTAMKTAMVGVSESGSTKIQEGIIAYWGAICTASPTLWITTPLIVSAVPPTLLSTIAVTLDPVFTSNAENKLSLQDSALAVATALHPLQLGALATLTPPPPATTVPIL